MVEIEHRKRIRIRAKDAAQLKEGAAGEENGEEVDHDAEEERELFPTTENEQIQQTITESLGAQKRAIKLVELGPRLKLELRKIEEGMVEGKVLYHRYIKKSEQEIKELDKKHSEKAKVKAERRKVQEQNIKNKEKTTRSQRGKEKAKAKEGGDDSDDDDDDDEEDDKDDAQYSDDDDLNDDDGELLLVKERKMMKLRNRAPKEAQDCSL